MKCNRALRLISSVIDGNASANQQRLLNFHLMGCSSCRKAYTMSRDISRLTRELPAPSPPATLETDVMRMISRETAEVPTGKRHFRASLLAIPAAAALIVLAVSISPLASTGSSAPRSLALSSSMPPGMKVMSADRSTAKSRVRTVPLSAYSRQANLISF